jgi:hypothetical protein
VSGQLGVFLPSFGTSQKKELGSWFQEHVIRMDSEINSE